MKKSEKIKGKESAAARRKTRVRYGIVAIAGIIIIAVVWLVMFNPVVAKSGDTVDVYYTGTLDNGTVFDSNVNGTPLEFTLGSGQMIPGFNDAVTGMAVGEVKTVRLSPDQAYGPYHPEEVVQVNRSANFSVSNPVIGERLTVTNPSNGATTTVKIINVTSSTITVDANPDLAGQNLTFMIKLATIGKK